MANVSLDLSPEAFIPISSSSCPQLLPQLTRLAPRWSMVSVRIKIYASSISQHLLRCSASAQLSRNFSPNAAIQEFGYSLETTCLNSPQLVTTKRESSHGQWTQTGSSEISIQAIVFTKNADSTSSGNVIVVSRNGCRNRLIAVRVTIVSSTATTIPMP